MTPKKRSNKSHRVSLLFFWRHFEPKKNDIRQKFRVRILLETRFLPDLKVGRNFLDPDIFEAPPDPPETMARVSEFGSDSGSFGKKLVDPKFILFSKNRILVYFFTFYHFLSFFFCSTSLLLASTRWVRMTSSSSLF